MSNINQRKVNKREFRDSGSITNNKICFEVRAIALRPRLHTEGFSLYRPHREPLLRIWVIQLWSTQLLSKITNKLYTRGKTQQQSPLHLEGWALSQTTITLH